MKKILIASTALALTAGVASADTAVKISGYGRFGIVHTSGGGVLAPNQSATVISQRLRLNFDASMTIDSGVEFGGRLRIQSGNPSTTGTTPNSAYLYASYQGLKVEVGNTDTAYDSASLLWDSEMGYQDSSFGDPVEYTYYYNSGGVPSAGYMGVYASYTVGDFNVQVSHVSPDQTVKNLPAGQGSETGIALYDKFGAFSVAAAYTNNGAGIKGNNPWFIGAAYAINDKATIGLNYLDESMSATAQANGGFASDPAGKTTTLYGNYKMDAITMRAYVAHNDRATNATKNAIGIGADYDLGGARLSGSIQRGYAKQTVVDLGVRFNF